MLGPIPNALGAGAYNGTFFPHGLVTFSSRGVFVIFQEICVDALVQTTVVLGAGFVDQVVLDAGFVDRVPLEARQNTINALEAEAVTVKTLEGLIEECN